MAPQVHKAVVDGNEAAARVAYHFSEVIAIYPITPASPMGELSEAWARGGRRNSFGQVPAVIEMQSEAGAAGTVHGALQAGALSTTFTASQGLLLMIPNMFKIAGELNAAVIHVAARTVATHALSIFGDHSDVMAVRTTGFAMLCSGSVQEAQDFAAISHIATLEGRVPVLHFFDGFRTSHELARIDLLSNEELDAMLDSRRVHEHRARGLTPDRPFVRGTAQNPDVFFQAREACSPWYARFPGVVQQTMDSFAALTGRQYRLFEYAGAPDAERVIVMMGSGAETASDLVEQQVTRGEKLGLVKVRLYRPFDAAALLAVLPKSVRAIAVLDRTKEPGASGEPLFLDVSQALYEGLSVGTLPFATPPRLIGGRYGLSSKEFTPAMVQAVFDELKRPEPKARFTVGIIDDVSHSHLPVDPTVQVETPDDGTQRWVFFGLGSDGTVGANKNTLKILGKETDGELQGYFVYDSKKAGSITVSHLRFSPRRIRQACLIGPGLAQLVACHHEKFLWTQNVVELAAPGGVLLLNSERPSDQVFAHLPADVAEQIRSKHLRLFVIDAGKVAREAGLGARINTVMQTCFFELMKPIPIEKALDAIEREIQTSYGGRGPDVVAKNVRAARESRANLHEVEVPPTGDGHVERPDLVPSHAPAFVRDVTAWMLKGMGDRLPVSALPPDGTFESATAKWEKRGIAAEIPVWDEKICIQCAKCAIVCPHAAIRMKLYEPAGLEAAPATFQTVAYKGREHAGMQMTIQVAPDDCTGCELCAYVCPAKDRSNPRHKALDMKPAGPLLERERTHFEYFLDLPEIDRSRVLVDSVKGSQMLEPLFEFSGACAGCGETPYLKLLSQLFGDRLVIANATGCSSIYGGNLPTTPWSKNREGRGPAWSNSLFEDAAEFGLGFRLAYDQMRTSALELLRELRPRLDPKLCDAIESARPVSEADFQELRKHLTELRASLSAIEPGETRGILEVLDQIVPRSVWIVGGDGWAYDIGFGGLDHVLASGRNIKILLLDTEVYSNTGGQMSKATPRAAVAKFAAGGKQTPKKDLGMIAMAHKHVYVAQVALGANDRQTVKALIEAERFDGPALVIAYSHCIAHGIFMAEGMNQQKQAVGCGHFPLYRFDPARAERGENPLEIDSGPPKIPFRQFAQKETRFQMLWQSAPEEARRLELLAMQDIAERWSLLKQMAEMRYAQPAVEANR